MTETARTAPTSAPRDCVSSMTAAANRTATAEAALSHPFLAPSAAPKVRGSSIASPPATLFGPNPVGRQNGLMTEGIQS